MHINQSNWGPRCETCRFARGSYFDTGTGPIFCHRYPPTIDPTDHCGQTIMPMVDPKLWCGEYKEN